MNHAKQLGRLGEQYAKRLYRSRHYVVIAENIYNDRGKQLGEIDFVAVRDKQICFVEVKTRNSIKFGLPEMAISKHKHMRLIKAAQWFLNKHSRYKDFWPQIDICAILTCLPTTPQFKCSSIDKYVKYAKIYANAVEMK